MSRVLVFFPLGFIPSTMVITIIIILAKRGSFLGLAQSAVCLTLT